MAQTLQPGRWRQAFAASRAWLPTGRPLPPEGWNRHHRVIVGLLWGFVVIVPVWALWRGYGLLHAAEETLVVVPFAVLASWTGFVRRLRATMAAFGLLAAAATLVHLSGGLIELHFLFFIMVGIITLYQDWIVFLLAVAFVAIHHGAMGALDPHLVYSHQAAWNSPWKWAGIHAFFILCMSAVGIVAWKLNEDLFSEVQVSAGRFRGQFESAAVGEAMVDLEGRYLEVNPALCEMLGYPEEELCGLELARVTHPDDRERSQLQMQRLLAGEIGSYDIDKRYLRRDGAVIHCVISIAPVCDADGKILYFAEVIQDVTDRKHAQDALEHQALHDPLTGLPNRSLLVDRVSHALAHAQRSGLHTAVLILDIDRFKGVNDSLGHAKGDEILAAVAARLQTSARTGDTVARLGGDEFIVLCEDLNGEEEAREVAERLLGDLARPLPVDDWHYPLTTSIGIAVAKPGDVMGAATLLASADAAMYRAKDHGRDRCEMFDVDMRSHAIERLEMEHQLRQAINGRELDVHYQPLLSLADGRVTGVEALVRWYRPERGFVPPVEFIPMAEELGLVVPLGAFVLEQACHAIATWNRANPTRELDVAVNLSTTQVSYPGIADTVRASLQSSGLEPARLCLEITETALLEDVAANAMSLDALKALGVRLAVDDFGTGYSSLVYLKRLPVDVLKVDRTFTDGVGREANDTAIVGAIIGLAHALGLHAVAEGVERLDQVEALSSLGCDSAQGFHWTPALPADELEDWLLAHRAEAPSGVSA